MPLRVLLALCVLALAAVPVEAAEYSVATNGNNSNPGTLAQPWASINYARTRVSAGDTVWIRGGTYAEELAWYGGPKGTSWSNPISFRRYSGEGVTVRPGGGENALRLSNQGAGQDNGSQFLIFDGITFDGRNVSNDVVKISEWDGNSAGGPRHIRFTNFRVTSVLRSDHASQQGLLIHAADIQLIVGEIDNVGGLGGPGTNSQGIYGAGDDLLVDQVHLHHINGWCMSNINSYAGIDGNRHTIRNNVVHDCLFGGINEGEGTGTIVYNNVVYNTPNGIFINDFGAGRSNGIRVYNNTVYNNSTYGISVSGNNDNTIVRNNIAFGNGQDYHNTRSGTVADHNLFGVNPMFVDAGARNFALQAGSPAVNTGMNLAEVTADIVGLPRPQGNAHDIGSHERGQQSAGGVPPPPPTNLRIVN